MPLLIDSADTGFLAGRRFVQLGDAAEEL
jgi:hypothetical protein